MADFIVKTLVSENLVDELSKIGFDSGYKFVASEKFKYKNIKIFSLTSAQANILKQTAISVGADCATHRDVITGNAELSNAILGGSYSQLQKIAKKLINQPFSLKLLSEKIIKELQLMERKTKLVGILNITPDSFSDGGKYIDVESAIEHAYQLIDDGADVLDIGAESTRYGAEDISYEEQIARLKPVLNELKNISIPISIDTRNSKVAEFVLNNGAKIINDVSGFDYDKRMIDVVSDFQAGIVIQHSKGTPQNMQDNTEYNDVVEEVYLSLMKKTELASNRNLKNIILDVGIGFGKTKKHNFELLNRIEEFYSLNLPLMVGVSRKSLLGLEESDNNELKDALSLAISYPLIQMGVDYLRVHNVKLYKQLSDLTI